MGKHHPSSSINNAPDVKRELFSYEKNRPRSVPTVMKGVRDMYSLVHWVKDTRTGKRKFKIVNRSRLFSTKSEAERAKFDLIKSTFASPDIGTENRSRSKSEGTQHTEIPELEVDIEHCVSRQSGALKAPKQ